MTVEATAQSLIAFGLACFAVGYTLASLVSLLVLVHKRRKD